MTSRRVLQSGARPSGLPVLGPPWGTWGLRGLWSADDADQKNTFTGRGRVLSCFAVGSVGKIQWKCKTEMRVRGRGGRGACTRWSRPARIPRMPRERGDKITPRDPKWAVLWRGWKKAIFWRCCKFCPSPNHLPGSLFGGEQNFDVWSGRNESSAIALYHARRHALCGGAHKVHGVTFWVSLVRLLIQPCQWI